jgi:ABC-type transporter Mla subunit MlaD
MNVPLPRPAPSRFQQQQPPSFDQLAKKIDFDVTQLGQVSQYLRTLAQMVESVRAEARDADKPLRVGARQASPFADPRAGDPVDRLLSNTRSVHKNVQDSLADLQQCLTQTAAAMDRIAKSVHDNSQNNQKQLRQLLDSAFNPQAARSSGQPSHSMPPMRPTRTT